MAYLTGMPVGQVLDLPHIDGGDRRETIEAHGWHMILVKHFLDRVDPKDGERLWVEPIPLTIDLREWCQVDGEMPTLAPKRHLWEWFRSHPDHYEYFRGMYHAYLQRDPAKALAIEFAMVGSYCNFTLLHQGDDAAHNSAAALLEYINELQLHSSPPRMNSTDLPEL